MPEPQGLKHDQGKPRMDLLDPDALTELSKVLTFGAQKYDAHNWRKGINYSRIIAAAMRHMNAILGGEDIDPETGLLHAAHVMCNMQFLIAFRDRRDLDDRWRPEKTKEKGLLPIPEKHVVIFDPVKDFDD